MYYCADEEEDLSDLIPEDEEKKEEEIPDEDEEGEEDLDTGPGQK